MKRRAQDAVTAATGLLVLAVIAMVAGLGAIVTSAGGDQRQYHFPSVMQLRGDFPDINLVDLPIATGPLYHLIVAAISGPLSLNERGTQIIGGLFAVALAILTLWSTQSINSFTGRLLAAAPLLLSAYFWQSAIWMLTDDAALLFSMAAMILLLGSLTPSKELAVGLLIALAIATRQTSVWVLAPALVACVQDRREGPIASWGGSVIRVAAPGVVTLAALVVMWGGLTPPEVRAFNASGFSPVGPAYTCAVIAIFSVPLLLSTVRSFADIASSWRAAVAVATIAAIPAVAFPSAATIEPDHSRRGGLIWIVVGAGGDIAGRSPVLVILAFLGAFTGVIVVSQLSRERALIVGAGAISVAIVVSAGAQLFQKYVELPIAMLAVLVIVQLRNRNRIERRWPLAGLALLQAAVTIGIVGVPILRAFS